MNESRHVVSGESSTRALGCIFPRSCVGERLFLFPLFSQPVAQISRQGGIQRLAGAQLHVVGLMPRTTQPHFLQIRR